MSGVATTRLTPGEISLAAHIGSLRRLKHLQAGTKPRYGEVKREAMWDIDIGGCMGEIACAKFLNLYWEGTTEDMDARDVGGLVDVRAVSHQHYRLVLHQRDPDDVPFVNAWVHGAEVELQGWMFAREGKLKEYWSELAEGRFAFAVPKSVPLHPMQALRDWVELQPPLWRQPRSLRISIAPANTIDVSRTLKRVGELLDGSRL